MQYNRLPIQIVGDIETNDSDDSGNTTFKNIAPAMMDKASSSSQTQARR
jgi:hypothetical protein